jgi:hypothetical protein
MNIDSLDLYISSANVRSLDQVIHPVKTPQQCRLTATGGPDESSHLLLWNPQRDVKERLGGPVEEVQIFYLNDWLSSRCV